MIDILPVAPHGTTDQMSPVRAADPEIFGDDTVAAAMIDRLVHHVEIVNIEGDSYRLKDRDLGRTPPAHTSD